MSPLLHRSNMVCFQLGTGLYPIKCTVRGDKSCAEGFMAVVPHETECVVFSIDGSFTLNMSLMGRDAKIRPGAVEACIYRALLLSMRTRRIYRLC